MCVFEPFVSLLVTGASFRAALVTDPEAALAACALTLDDAGRAALACLRPLLALPAGALLQRLLDGGPDGPQRWWNAPPSPDQTVP